ncbi:N-acetylgalactosamine-N, N'-diacetylbacillosaminyl-diphospho-undecaprenol4-alpha-N-acetylgalactosaminyltransferase [Methylobacterium adhaesivum]|uniref:Glycosyltransferase n=1 Tax=Methylobacterium adhaesivum TaxID=333297 RepID=A0ABT8BL96_9HYPH|nr:glycosyltransferase [Methylobacterium adhaesivum]MDN3592573.1 glycosyltransferase [Methylobacterium adhaesivum]GJD30177.1 N-acetylgalactosamine-N, N'-diacetylbacillosaminyl-diphospho-undecaprenol4-alpha-N-acetylgalactosaminyltransferase [Methylobacterium adhaesivum]
MAPNGEAGQGPRGHGDEGPRVRRSLLFYTHAVTGGGAERVWALLASGLAARGHTVTLAYDHDADGAEAALDPRVRRLALGANHAVAVARLARHLAREKPDLSLSALAVSNLKHAAAALLAGRARRAVLSFHGHPASEPQRLSRLGNAATPVLTRLTAGSIFVSDGLMAHYVRKAGAAPGRAVRLYNPVEVAAARPARDAAELLARPRRVLAVGRLAPAKDFATLLRAFARVRSDASLVIVGEGPERPALEALVETLGLQARVTLTGHVERPWHLYREAACFAASSRAEAFGNVLVEALAHGLPVASTACDGPVEILAGGRFGALVPVGDAPALAAAIDAMLADPGAPDGRVARAATFSVDAAVARYEALFDTLLAGRDRR